MDNMQGWEIGLERTEDFYLWVRLSDIDFY